MTLSEKSAYLKGLMEGMKLDTETNEGKLISEIISMLQDVAENVSDLEEVVDCISDELDCIEEDLDNIDDYLMDDDDDEYEHHHHHHGHDADEVFISWGEETHKKFTKAEIERILKALEDAETYGIILRAKGYVANAEGEKWIHFDYVPGEPDIRDGGAMVTGRICVIGSKLNEEAVAKLFGVEKQ